MSRQEQKTHIGVFIKLYLGVVKYDCWVYAVFRKVNNRLFGTYFSTYKYAVMLYAINPLFWRRKILNCVRSMIDAEDILDAYCGRR